MNRSFVLRTIACSAGVILIVLATWWAWAARHSTQPRARSAPGAGGLQWNAFRGPSTGVSPWANAPTDWDGPTGKGVIWKTSLKMAGVSSPIVWGDRVFLTEGGDKERAVLAFDATDGRQLWRQVVPDGGKGEPLPSVSDAGLALPTPACDANGVYVLFGTGDLAAFSHEGRPLWQKFLGRPVIGYGFASSPCLREGLLFLQVDTHENGRVLAIETATGNIRWERERMRGAAWSSPIIVPSPDAGTLFVANAAGSLTAFNMAGEVVWDIDGVTGEVAPSPAYANGSLCAVNVGASLLCYTMAKEPQRRWQYTGALSDTSSPVVVNGLVFMAAASGQIVCVDALTGEELWTHTNEGCYASLVASGDRVYALGRSGKMTIVGAERAYRLIATCRLGEGSDATPAMGDDRIFIRGRDHLWCIGGPGESRAN
jgi:outer membrane protein assembly factor BamB